MSNEPQTRRTGLTTEKMFHLLGAVVDVILRVAGSLCEVQFPQAVIAHHAGRLAESGRSQGKCRGIASPQPVADQRAEIARTATGFAGADFGRGKTARLQQAVDRLERVFPADAPSVLQPAPCAPREDQSGRDCRREASSGL